MVAVSRLNDTVSLAGLHHARTHASAVFDPRCAGHLTQRPAAAAVCPPEREHGGVRADFAAAASNKAHMTPHHPLRSPPPCHATSVFLPFPQPQPQPSSPAFSRRNKG